MRRIASILVALALLLAVPLGAAAQDVPPPEPAATDPFGRETPRTATDGLVAAFAADDPAEVLPYLDLSDIPEARQRFTGRRLAIQLEAALDQSGGILPSYLLSSAPAGQTGDAMAADLDRFAVLRVDGEDVDLTLRRSEVDGIQVWRVSPETLEITAAQAGTAESSLYSRLAPASLTGTRLWGVELAAWTAVLAAGAGAIVFSVVLVWLLWAGLRLVVRPLRKGTAGRLLRPLRLPLALVLGAMTFTAALIFAGVPVVARATVAPFVEIGTWVAIAWMIWRLVNAAGDEAQRSMTRRARHGAVSVVIMARRLAKALVLLGALILVANSLGLNLTGWFAALGIGGLAIALGAQKTIEHLVGGVSLIADQPIRVGDFCQVDGVTGTVEDIGLRSTRIRTLDNTLVTIPNGSISSTRIENYAGRTSFHWHVTLGLRYETSPDQMRAVLGRIDAMLEGDARIAEGQRVRFLGFGPSSLDVEIFAYIVAIDYARSLAIREELNLALMEILAECGTGFAFPSSTVYLARDRDAPHPATRGVAEAA
ncbi:mechanosensitive ion channel family protein [Jannaschia sp. W003]|uniref:mechanosensitive ion channel family protein n=1 Tax=Jannaschia sp. W003 TaxID=2867012 RepID=UPI0021A6491B|nr:mechanosensitive ion channel family protein [Jannaschia sp. W003]UWQ21532.1 mechanosensitive ion channel family protein [Jannaschia sp. W003]